MPSPESVRQPATQSPAAPYFANYVTNQLVRPLRREARVRRRAEGRDDDRPRAAEARARGDRQGAAAVDRAERRARRASTSTPGQVVAMVGGRNYRASQFNLATQGERQPGSAFKPFVLAAALRDGIAPSSILVSHPVVIDAGGRAWSVHELRAQQPGPDRPVDGDRVLRQHGLRAADEHRRPRERRRRGRADGDHDAAPARTSRSGSAPSRRRRSRWRAPTRRSRTAATGSTARCSATSRSPSRASRSRRRTRASRTRRRRTRRSPRRSRGSTNGNAAIEDQMLQGVVQYGTGTAAQLPGWQVAGKTGTTENYGDAWFVGFTPDLVTAVWVGYPNKLIPMLTEYHGHTVEGGTFPALIWKAFMQKALPYRKLRPDVVPVRDRRRTRRRRRSIFRDGKLAARQRQLPGRDDARVLHRYGADGRPRRASRTRSRCPTSAARRSRRRKTRLIGQPLLSTVVYAPAKPGRRSASSSARSRGRDALGLRQGEARRLPGRVRRRAEARRAARSASARAQRSRS